MKEWMKKEVLEAKLSGIRTFNQLALEQKDSLLLTLGEPDFNTPIEIKEEAKKALDENFTHYSQTVGEHDLILGIIEYEKAFNHVSYNQNEVIVTVGSTEAITGSLFSVLNPKDEVIIPIPAFTLYECSLKMAGATYVPLDTSENNFQISKEMLDKVITPKTKAIVLTSPSNPTGVILSLESLKNIYEAIKGKPIFVIADDCYEQLVYTTRVPSFSIFQDIRKQIIITKSFSKSYAMTGFRIGYLLCDQEIAQELVKNHQFMVTTVATFVQKAALKALSVSSKEMVESYKERRDYVYNRLLKMNMEVVKPEGAFYIFPSIKKYGLTSLDFCTKLLMEKKVAFVPGIYFGTDGFVRISYCVPKERLEKALDLLEEFLHEFE